MLRLSDIIRRPHPVDTALLIQGTKTRDLRRVMILNSPGTETLKIIASQKPINVSLLERTDLVRTESYAGQNPLERLLISTLDTRSDTGSIAIGEWGTSQVAFEVN
jgi:hypothetical protein